ncbi:MAG: hypothetical protein JSU63_13525 [Phycisphaerales bacterium]|nr:MAG: hypothetical protein JSU63_13525 [Phycisphaerales bacterium]
MKKCVLAVAVVSGVIALGVPEATWSVFGQVINDDSRDRRGIPPSNRADCNSNGISDECDLDCGASGGPCDISGCGESMDCNSNDVPDECDIADLTSNDCQPDGTPDECQLDQVIILPEYGPCSPAASSGQAWCEDFETYPVGPVNINGWYGWGAPTYSGVSPITVGPNHTPGGTKSMNLVIHETLHRFEGYDIAASSAWVLSTWVLIPQTMAGTADYRVQSEYNGAFNETLAFTLSMSATQDRIVHTRSGQWLPLVEDDWAEIRTVIDFDRDLVMIYYNDALLATQAWTVLGGPLDIAGVEFWSWSSSGCYFDDLSLFPARRITTDCFTNGIPDSCDIVGSLTEDCNDNFIPDQCEPDNDCQPNGIQDICDLAGPTGADCNGNHIPDDCEPNADCNGNSIQDICDIGDGTSLDCNATRVPDECELVDNDCNVNGSPDDCDVLSGVSADCNGNTILDECELSSGASADCQTDNVPDECQLEGVMLMPHSGPCSAAADNGEALCDDFESYEIGILSGINGWEGFGNNPMHAGRIVNAQNHTPGGSQSINNGSKDVLRVLSGYDISAAPAWVLRAWVYVPSTMNGPAFFLVDSDYDGTFIGCKNSVKLLMDPALGVISDWLEGSTLPLIMDEWVEVRVLIDFQRDLVTTYYDDVLLSTHPWTFFTCSAEIKAIHLLGLSSTTGFYCDDLSLFPAHPATTDCLDNGIPDECDLASCAGDPACGDCNGNEIPDGCELEVFDCNANAMPDDCDLADCVGDPACDDCNSNHILDWCDIDSGTTTDNNANGIPDVCDAQPPLLPATPHDTRKNRYVSFAPNNTDNVAFQVEMTASGEFPQSTGVLGWVGEADSNGVSRLIADPYFSDSWPELVHLSDCEIIPVATYAIRATVDAINFTDPLAVGTIIRPGVWFYGDTVGVGTGALPPDPGFTAPNQIVNVNDVTAYLLTAHGDTTPSAHTTWVDLHGLDAGVAPNYILNVSDLQRILFGLEGQRYDDASDQLDPADCP